MGLIKNAINFGNGFNIGAVAPIDSRMRVELLADLTTAWTADMPAYKGMIVTVMETSEVYVLKDADNYTRPDSWVKLGSAASADAGAADALKQAKDYTDQLANGAVKTNTNAIATLNGGASTTGSVAYAVATETTRAMAAEKTNADAISAETTARTTDVNAINTKIGTVPEGKNVVGMIADAETAAKAAATKMKLATSEELLTLSHTTDEAGAITYTIGTNNVASDAELQTEKERALAAESALTTRVATNEGAIATLNGNASTSGSVAYAVATETTRAEGKEGELLTAINNETSARTTADTALANRLTKIEGDEQTVGSIKKAVADAKSALLGDAATDYNTLGKLEDKIIELSGDAKTYSISQVVGDELTSLGANVKEAYKLVENGNERAGEYIKVYKDSALQSVALVGQELQFTYLLASGNKSTVSVDVSNFLAESEFANGLQVVDHVVSVKRDAASEGFLTVGTNGIKLSGVQSAINTAKKEVTDSLDIIKGEETVNGSIKKALKDAKTYTDTKINGLDATVGSQIVASGNHVAVEVVEEDGKLTNLTVTESDIASKKALDDEVTRAKAAEEANAAHIATLNADSGTTGSVAKAVADAKSELLGGATTDYNTLGKLENKVKAVDAAAKAAATTITTKTDGHVKVSVSKNDSTSALTYTISESDIASAQELGALKTAIGTGFTTNATVTDRIAVLEGVTVIGKDAIVVSSSDAKTNKEVSLKLGKQPAEGEAGVVLSQDANGLVAKLQWGTF